MMAALQYVDVPGYNALILRRTFPELSQQGGMIELAHKWLTDTPAVRKEGGREWIFPSGASLKFGYLDTEQDKLKYRGAELQFVGFDETTTFTESQYSYLFSRLTKKEGMAVPTRMRGATNPGGPGHSWVKERFINSHHADRIFFPSFIKDNPSVDYNDYVRSMTLTDPFTREQLLLGSWDEYSGGLFRREWFEIIDCLPKRDHVTVPLTLIRAWDWARTAPAPGKDPDWTAGALLGLDSQTKTVYILDVVRERNTPEKIEQLVIRTAQRDGPRVMIWGEEEKGSAGGYLTMAMTKALIGYVYHGEKVSGEKQVRASPLSSFAEARRVKILRGVWNGAFLDELELFTGYQDGHDDMVDAAALAFNKLTQGLTGGYHVDDGKDNPWNSIDRDCFPMLNDGKRDQDDHGPDPDWIGNFKW